MIESFFVPRAKIRKLYNRMYPQGICGGTYKFLSLVQHDRR